LHSSFIQRNLIVKNIKVINQIGLYQPTALVVGDAKDIIKIINQIIKICLILINELTKNGIFLYAF